LDVTKVFLDTNILVYAVDERDPAKHDRAIAAVEGHIRNGSGVISTQVLQEFASVTVAKLHQKLDVIRAELSVLEALEIVQITPLLVRRALELHGLHQINYWDAAILAAAEAARCARLWSEDFAPGSLYGLLRVENPLTG
jgi:predicted nucleic acid-binding protein